MSRMPKSVDVLAILCGDLHLSHSPPTSRSGQKDWYRVMEFALDQIADLSQQYSAPIVCAGDVFDRWNSPPELINFALANLPPMFAIPGQHDLPWHGLGEVHRSAYETLVRAEVITPLQPDRPRRIASGLWALGFPWGVSIQPPPDEERDYLAVSHQYVWIENCGYTGAPEEAQLLRIVEQLRGYRVAHFGDNHNGFTQHISGKNLCVANCGGMIQRRIDERQRKPMVCLLNRTARGTYQATPCFLDTGEVQWSEPAALVGVKESGQFVEQLKQLSHERLDFDQYLRIVLQGSRGEGGVREVLLEVLDECTGAVD